MSLTHKHTKPVRKKWFGIPVGWLIAILAGGAVAIAAIVYTLGFSGSFNFTVAENFEIEYADLADNSHVNCTDSFTATNLSIDTWPDIPADCEIAVVFTNEGNAPAYVADFTTSDPLLTVTSAWSGPALPSGGLACHDEIPVGGAQTLYFPITLSVDSPTSAGTYTVDVSTLQIEFSDNATDGDCDSSTA